MCRVILCVVSDYVVLLFHFLYSVLVLCNSIGSIMIPILLLLTTVKLLLLLLIVSHHNKFGRYVGVSAEFCYVLQQPLYML